MAKLYKEYRIVGEVGDYQIAENFGQYRLLKKRFKTVEQARIKIDELSASRASNA